MAKEELEAVIEELGLSIKAEFVPWSKSRAYDKKNERDVGKKSLNWRVTLIRTYKDRTDKNGEQYKREILTTDYGAGIAHCPSYKQKFGRAFTLDDKEEIEYEIEHGKKARRMSTSDTVISGRELILPDTVSVIWSLVQDADAIDSPDFETWATDLGYDVDSRKAEATYRACLEIATKIRAAVGEEGLKKLREAGQDY